MADVKHSSGGFERNSRDRRNPESKDGRRDDSRRDRDADSRDR